MSNIFPLAPNHILRCLWVLCQLIFAISLVGLSSQPVTGHNYFLIVTDHETTLTTANVSFSFALLFLVWSCCDILASFLIVFQKYFSQRQNQQPHEAEPLLHYNWRTSCKSRYKDWLYNYSDILRLVITEIVTHLILVSPAFASIMTGFLGDVTNPVNIAMLVCSTATFLLLVYVIQLMLFVKFTMTLWRQMKPPT